MKTSEFRKLIRTEIKKSIKEDTEYPDTAEATRVLKSIKNIYKQLSPIMAKAGRLKAWKNISYRPDELEEILDEIIHELQEEYGID